MPYLHLLLTHVSIASNWSSGPRGEFWRRNSSHSSPYPNGVPILQRYDSLPSFIIKDSPQTQAANSSVTDSGPLVPTATAGLCHVLMYPCKFIQVLACHRCSDFVWLSSLLSGRSPNYCITTPFESTTQCFLLTIYTVALSSTIHSFMSAAPLCILIVFSLLLN